MAARSQVVLLQLEKQLFFDEQYAGLVKDIKSKADVRVVQTANRASALFTGNECPVVFATDETLSLPEYRRQRAEAALFVRTGGTIIFGAHFSSFAKKPNITSLFAGFSLPWQPGDYHRTDFDLNTSMEGLSHVGLVDRCSRKALQLKNVNNRDALYLPASSSRIQSSVFSATPIDDLTQSPAAFGSLGEGKVGYMGDVNSEMDTEGVVLAMLGLN